MSNLTAYCRLPGSKETGRFKLGEPARPISSIRLTNAFFQTFFSDESFLLELELLRSYHVAPETRKGDARMWRSTLCDLCFPMRIWLMCARNRDNASSEMVHYYV